MRINVSYDGMPQVVKDELDHRLQQLIQDCLDRPNYDADRKVTLQILVRPADPKAQRCDEIEFDTKCSMTIPATAIPGTRARVSDRKQGTAWWNDFSSDNPKQSTIDEVDENGEVHGPK